MKTKTKTTLKKKVMNKYTASKGKKKLSNLPRHDALEYASHGWKVTGFGKATKRKTTLKNKIGYIEKKVMKENKMLKTHFKKSKTNWINESIRKKLGIPKVTNTERSIVEVHQFKQRPPKKYTAYMGNKLKKVTTWTGQPIGKVTWVGSEYKDSMGGTRQNFRINAVNKKKYSGTYFKSSGDYVNLKMLKDKIKAKKK